jgi:transcription antitermination factor NusG
MPEILRNEVQNESILAVAQPCIPGPDWFALQTRARWERKVCTQVEGKGHEAYVPVLRQRRRWSDRFQVIEVPLFPGYVFVREVMNHNDRLAILQTSSVHGFVNFSGMIARIPEHQIADLRRIEEQSTGCTPWPFMKAGQRVRIHGGCLDGLEGIFVAESAGNRLVISIVPMQRSIAVSLDDYDFEVIGNKRLD